MSRFCPITGKGPLSGNNRSHSLRATRRVQNPNLQKFQININGKMATVRMSARGYRSLMKTLNKNGNAKKVVAPKIQPAPAPVVEEVKVETPAVEETQVENPVEEEKANEESTKDEVAEEETKE